MTRKQCLDGAAKAVLQDRQDIHGPPEETFETIAQFWSSYLGFKVHDFQVGVLMGLFKIARMKYNPSHEDSVLDAVGYLACASELAPSKEKWTKIRQELFQCSLKGTDLLLDRIASLEQDEKNLTRELAALSTELALWRSGHLIWSGDEKIPVKTKECCQAPGCGETENLMQNSKGGPVLCERHWTTPENLWDIRSNLAELQKDLGIKIDPPHE